MAEGEQKEELYGITKLLVARMETNPEEFDEEAILSRWGATQKQFEAHAPTADLTVYFVAKQNMIMKKLFEQMVKGLTRMASVEDTQAGIDLQAMAQAQYNALSSTKKE